MTTHRPAPLVAALLMLALALALSLSACKDDKSSNEEAKKEESVTKDPKAMCETIFNERKDAPIYKDTAEKYKQAFMDHCVKLPPKYLSCRTDDLLAMSEEQMRECREQLMSKHSEELETILMKGTPQ